MPQPKPIKLLIAPIGNPYSYPKMGYRWRGEGKGEDKRIPLVDSSTSIPITFRRVNPDKVVLFVADTAGIGESAINYAAIHENGIGRVKEFFSGDGELLSKMEFDLVPVETVLGKRKVIYGKEYPIDIENSHVITLLKVATVLLQLLQERGVHTPVELHLDITHGNSFTAPLLLKNLQLLGSGLSYFTSVTLFVYTSTPVDGKGEVEERNIQRLFTETLPPSVPRWRVNNGIDSREVSINRKIIKRDKLERLLNGVIGGFYFSLPLLIAESVPFLSVTDLFNYLEHKKKEFQVGGKNFAIPLFQFDHPNWKSVVLASFLVGLTKLTFPQLNSATDGVEESILKEIATLPTFLSTLPRLEFLREKIEKREKQLEQEKERWVVEFEERFFNRILEFVSKKVITEYEISNPLIVYEEGVKAFKASLYEKIESDKSGWHLLNTLFVENPKPLLPERRYFLVRGGIVGEVVEFKKEGEKIYYRYLEEYRQEIVDNLADPTRQVV